MSIETKPSAEISTEQGIDDVFRLVLGRYKKVKEARCSSLLLFFDENDKALLRDKFPSFLIGRCLDNSGNVNYFVKTLSKTNRDETIAESDEIKRKYLEIAKKEPIIASYALVNPTAPSRE